MSAEDKIRVTKTINETIAENMDNKQTLKEIVATVTQGKGLFYDKTLLKFINYTTKQKNRTPLEFAYSDFLLPSQPRNAFSANWDGGLNSGFFEQMPLKSLMPWMITGPQYMGKPDSVVELLKHKKDWDAAWHRFKGAMNNKKNIHKWFGKDVLRCPKVYLEMAAHVQSDPDPYLKAEYNWYYAGRGNLQLTRLEGRDYIMHSEFHCLYVSPFNKDNLTIDYANGATYKCPEELKILETTHSEHFIALRTKHKVIILQLITAELPLKIQRLKEIDTEYACTSAKFDQFHRNMLYVTTLDYNLKIVNLNRMAARNLKLRGKFTTLTDNWSMVLGAERGSFIHTSRQAVTIYDKRTNQPYQRFKTFNHITDLKKCSQITAVKYCDDKPLMYLATEHHLFLVDMRCGRTKHENIKPVQRWNHGMISPPVYIDMCPYEPANNKELVCLASQWVEDMCVVDNYSDTLTRAGEIQGLSMPYRPPNIMDTFNESHRQKMCYTAYDKIQKRLSTCISGMTITKQGDKTSILMHNALGDISCHALYPRHMCSFIEDDSIEKFHIWCKDYKEESPLFEVSHVINIQTLWRDFRKVPEFYQLGRNTIIKPRENFNEKEIDDTYENEVIDPEFLEIWKKNSHEEEITLGDTNANGSQLFVE